ncbi:unnamed protein product [Peniophora sp. CBMAI 1063]|nr:unnamed protein product [Peniophora sp. CBMAI 1063]
MEHRARQAWIAHAHARLGPVDKIAHNRASPSSDILSAREAAKAELDAAAASMAVIRVSLNSLEPACRLSPDVLIQIFLWARDLDAPENQRYGPRYGWLALSQVCNLWRNTALECRSLWNEPVLSLGPEWVEVFALRSSPAPLFLKCDTRMKTRYSSGMDTKRVRPSLEHIVQMAPQRVAKVDFAAPWTIIEPVLSVVFAHATSLAALTSVSLQTDKNYGALQMPDNTFSASLSSLTAITLPDALLGFPWTLLPSTLKSITILSSGHSLKATESRQVLTGLYRLLRRSADLALLSLDFEDLPSWSHVAGKKGLDLPQLRTLRLNGQAEGCLSVIASINTLRGLNKLEIGIKGTNWEALHVASFIPIIQSVSNSADADPFSRLSIAGDFTTYQTHFSMDAHRTSEYSHLVDMEPTQTAQTDPSLSIKFDTTEMPISEAEGRQLMLNLLSSVDTTRLESLHTAVRGLANIGWTASDWINHFRAAQGVQYLHVGRDCFSLFYALGSSTANTTPPSGEAVEKGADDALELVMDASEMLFPKLRALSCEDVDFKGIDHKVRIPAHQAFTRALTARMVFSGIPRKITMRKCKLLSEQVKWWATTVPARMRDWDADTLSARETYSNGFY